MIRSGTTATRLQGLTTPWSTRMVKRCWGCDEDSSTCHQVCVGHNLMGTKVHWLPAAFLQNSWQQVNQSGRSHCQDETDAITQRLYSLTAQNMSWCDGKASRPKKPFQRNAAYQIRCHQRLASQVDKGAMIYKWKRVGGSVPCTKLPRS
jgi:hypothetical protein